VYHVAARAPEGERLFLDDQDFARFESTLERILSPDCTCVAACALNTHYHLLLHVENDVLAKAVHLLNSRYAAAYKLRYGIRGHIFSERYMSVLVESDEHLLVVYRYIARNPVEAGLCENPADWKWSSYRAAIGLKGQFAFADPSLAIGACDGSLEQFRQFVETPWPAAPEPGPGPVRGLAPVLSSGARPSTARRSSRRV
jgi:REP element-mobilizing transposase RayT